MVKISNPKDGGPIVRVSKRNAENSAIMVQEDTPVVNVNKDGTCSFLNIETRYAFLLGKTEDWKNVTFKAGQEFPGRIIVKESTTKFYDEQKPMVFSEGHVNAGEIITHGGAPVYRLTIVVPENSELADEKLVKDKEPLAIEAIQPNLAFSDRK